MERLTRDSGFHHGYKHMTIKNKSTGRVENVRSKHNYYLENKEKEKRKLKKEWSEGDYDCISVRLT
jgi:hypothetical protein